MRFRRSRPTRPAELTCLYLRHRQLVSNVLITFLNTPRADTKRFEMLQLISSILSWSDDQREQVGLQRSSGLLSAPGVNASGSRPGKGHARSGKGKGPDDGLGEGEVRRSRISNRQCSSDSYNSGSQNFGQLWVEFLLKESNAAARGGGAPAPPVRSSSSATSSAPPSPGSQSPRFSLNDLPPILSPPLVSPTASVPSTRRPSFSSFISSATSSANVTAPPSIKEEDQ